MSYNYNQNQNFQNVFGEGTQANLGDQNAFPQMGDDQQNQQWDQNQQYQQYGNQQQYGQDQYGYDQQQQYQYQQQQQQYQQPAQQPAQQAAFPAQSTNAFAAQSAASSGSGGGFFASATASTFTPSSTEFVPQGVMAKTDEQFPDLADAFSAPKKKKQGPTKADLDKKKEEENAALPTKGKPAEFFYVAPHIDPSQRVPNNDQSVFMFTHYPAYGQDMLPMLDWLYSQAFTSEETERMRLEQDQVYKQGPVVKAKKGKSDEYDFDQEDTSFGAPVQKKNKGKAAPVERKVIKKDPAKVAKQEEVKKAKKIVDIDVKVDEDAITEVDETRQPCSLVFIGHVDAGKSTISGNLMYLMGVIDSRTIEKYKKEAKDKGRDSWWLAYVMDVNEDEKAKGKTVEVGRATFDTPTKQYTVFDAPGHKNYVPNMIMGAALADFGGLVISARKGEFEAGFEKDGQTREHVQLAKSLGVRKLVIIVNKMDDQSVMWAKSRWDEIQTGLKPFLKASGYSDDDLFWVPMSGLTGQNIIEPVAKTSCAWYNGPTLLDILDKLPLEARDPNGPLRIPVLDKMKDQGMVAHGKVESGTVRLGDKVALAPTGNPGQVVSILDGKNNPVRYARPGENVQIKLLHIDEEGQIQKGDVICPRDSAMPVTTLFEADLDLLELLDYKPIVSKGYTCIMHMHTYADDVIIKDLVFSEEKNEGTGEIIKKETPKFVRSFAKIRARMTVRLPLPLEKFENIPQLGRFTLRDEGKTIAVGRVLKYKPHKVDGFTPATTNVAAVTKQLDTTKITETKSSSDKNETLVFNLETGETEQEKKAMEGIAEGDEANEESD